MSDTFLSTSPDSSTSSSNSKNTVLSLHGGIKSPAKPKVIVISGPTASGKTRLGLWLANELDGEIISSDSVQVYRSLDVGSAKTPYSERQGIPHHLLDILDPTEEYNAGRFFEDARKATWDVLSRGKVPIVVGGTGLYLRWFLYGKPDTPKASPETAKEVESILAPLLADTDNGWDRAVVMLSDAGDSVTGKQLARNDWYRLARALEILKMTGKPRISFDVPSAAALGNNRSDASRAMADHNGHPEADRGSAPEDLDFDFRCFFLSAPRMDLYRRIDLRCEEMVAEGLLEEAHNMLRSGVAPNSNPASRSIGYRQAIDYLLLCREQQGPLSAESFLQFLGEFQQASRNFAKRQTVWFRSEKLFRWVDASLPVDELGSVVMEDFESGMSHKSMATPSSVEGESEARKQSLKDGKQMKSYRTELKLFSSEGSVREILDSVQTLLA